MFERYASVNIPEFLNVGSVIRQTEEGPFRTHLIMNAHRLTTFPDIKAEVTTVKQAQSAIMTKAGRCDGSGLVLEGLAQRSFPKVLEKRKNSEVTCWFCEKKGHRESECRKRQKGGGKGKSKGSKKGDGKRCQRET